MPNEIKPVAKYSIKERAKKVPFETRLYVFFYMNWLKKNVPKDRYHNEKEAEQAAKLAKKRVKEIMKIHNEWQKDGSPTYPKTKGNGK